MLRLLIFFFLKIKASCNLFNVDCQTTGALLSLDASCHASRNSSEYTISSNLTDIYLLDSIEYGPVSSNCALANRLILDYSHCFSANAGSDASVLNYTANVVKTAYVDGEEVFVGIVEEIFCEPFVKIRIEKKALASSALAFVGKNSITAVTPEIMLSGGEKLGAFVNVSITTPEDNLYSKEFVDCNITSEEIARLDACTFVELTYKLNFDCFNGHEALPISDNSEALICFDETNWNSCDIFTSSSVVSTYSTSYTHYKGGLGFYNGQPITVGSYFSDGHRKVETLSSTGWTSLADSPM
ncbi:unnamed protein product [Oikopleura dioica]|uniref:Uncharacterized protein n=1 Tax=Oikopleura dioica TaxID=34765 RepID=E4YQH4_OIKDI|nr:unnamed protein product [Oikopleura dioica]